MNYEDMLKDVQSKIKKGKQIERIQIIKPKITIQKNKTIIQNFEQFCNSIRRDMRQVAKFLYKELATSGSIEGNKLILQSRSPILDSKIDKYIKEYVYCSECGRPDTILQKEGKFYVMKCEACGARKTVKL